MAVGSSYKTWMANLSPEKRNIPVIYLAIPGSHDSLSFSITRSSDVSPDSPEIVQNLGRRVKCIANPIIYKWSKTQMHSVTAQLEQGIRYLDIRLISQDGKIFAAHGLYGGQLLPYLSEVNTFLEKNPEEIIFLDFQHFYNFGSADHNLLITALQTIFGRSLCPRSQPINTITLNEMSQKNEQIIVIYRSSEAQNVTTLWPSDALPTPWPNLTETSRLITYLNDELKQRRNTVGLVTQSVLTVDGKYIFLHPCSNLQKTAGNANQKMLPWINAQKTGENGLNIVICDFISDEFVKTVVNLNNK